MRKIILIAIAAIMAASAQFTAAAAPKHRSSDYDRYNGTMTPIPLPDTIVKWWPDSLTPYFINHVGRHGARYLSSPKKIEKLDAFLRLNARNGNLTRKGRAVAATLDTVIARTAGRWGALTPLGIAEEARIASLTASLCPDLLSSGYVEAISSYVPRVVESCYSFSHALADFSSRLEITAMEGRRFDPLVRFFTTYRPFARYLKEGEWKDIMQRQEEALLPVRPVLALLKDTSAVSRAEARQIALEMYSVAQAMQAAEIPFDPSQWMTPDEYRRCHDISNMQRWLRYSISSVTDLPAVAATDLLADIIDAEHRVRVRLTPSRTVAPQVAALRFGHAETLMPLLALMDIPGCATPLAPLDASTLPDLWNSAKVVPLGANIQLIYLIAPSGTGYVATMLNEIPTPPYQGAPLIVTITDFNSHMKSRIARFTR